MVQMKQMYLLCVSVASLSGRPTRGGANQQQNPQQTKYHREQVFRE